MSWLAVLLFSHQVQAAPLGDPSDTAVETALEEQIRLNMARLRLENAPPIYHVRYHTMELSRLSLVASLGSLVQEDASPFNRLAVEVRLGEPGFDNTGFVGWQNGFSQTSLPLVTTDYNLSLAAWRLTDRAYKQAVEQYSRKRAQFSPPESYPGDYVLTGATVATMEAFETLDTAGWSERVVELSAHLESETGVEAGQVHLGYEQGRHRVVDSEGTVVYRPLAELSLRALAHVMASDGLIISDHRTWTTGAGVPLPEQDLMVQQVGEMMAELELARSAEPLSGEYVGPVLFEDEAAVDLFRYILAPQLEGTPPEVPFDSWFGELGASNDSVRLDRRVLPAGWTAVDDPREEKGAGYFEYDLEGTPSRRVQLVADGIVRAAVMSRIPRKGTEGTTGHARGYPGDRAVARVSQMTVSPPSIQSSKKLRKSAIKAAAAYGRDWVYVVRRLQEPAVISAASNDLSMMSDGLSLPPPVMVYRLDAKGNETPVRGARFANISRWILRDVLAAGEQNQASYFASFSSDGYYGSPLEGLPTRIAAPSVLIGELELVASPGDSKNIRVLKVPTR
jgi:TldD protein